MNANKKILALLLALVMTLTAMVSVFTGCSGDKNPEDTTAEDTGTSTPEDTTPPSESKVSYSVKLQTIGGMLMKGVNVYVYNNDSLEEMVEYTTTDENGVAQFSLKYSADYRIVLSGVPQGYNTQDSYTFDSARTANITLTSSVIADTDLTGVNYKLGSVMHDFSVVDSDGTTHKLSDILKEKKACVLNFWYTTCSYCVEEFPYLNATYEAYKDKVEVLALNNYSGDDEDAVKLFKSSYGLTFPMAKDYSSLGNAIGLEGYPTTVVIDRYGVIVLSITGGTSEAVFRAAFEYVSADDYQQKLFENMEDLVPTEKPTLQMPSSDEMAAVLNKGDITVTYSPETVMPDAEYSWPFIIGEKNGTSCIYPSNAGKDNSFATLYANVELKAGQALAFDFLSSTESAADILFVLVDRKDIYQISGESADWATCYPFVAIEDGTYELSLCYFKDESTNTGDDTVYLKDLRVVSADSITAPTYIPRYAANHLREDGFGYESYATVVYNEADGYYHVGTVDGPILLADLMGSTRFSGESVYSLAYNGKMVVDGKNYYDDILPFCTMASNSTINGLCSVTQELAELLKIMAIAEGIESGNENQWLQMCCYYDAYGTGGAQLASPVQGLSPDTAYKATMGDENYVTYTRVIMPRGLWYEFIPETSGAYRITSHSDIMVEGWIFLGDKTQYYEYGGGERLYFMNQPEAYATNVSMVVYMEAGTPYYIDIAYGDVYQVGSFNFSVEYLGESYKQFTAAAPGYYTVPDDGEVSDDPAVIEALGIDVMMGSDGYYHEKLDDGTEGSIVYADFTYATGLFNLSINEMIELGAFDFSRTETDQEIQTYIKQYGDQTKEKLKEIYGDSFDAWAETVKLDECLQGITHGKGDDKTDAIKAYAAKVITDESAPELVGCVPVDAELMELLQSLVGKYSFDVENAWVKMCYYYRNIDRVGA
ncbi:MAG: redoxin family protein [Clostridia bacterium]|nr:redoxin family protein [Clostridia bacterium]